LYEELINQSIKTLLNDNKEIQFIGNPYDISQNPGKGGEIIFTYKLDVYPEVVVVSDAWKKIKPDAIDSTVSDSDVQTSYNTLRRQYADYQDADEISMDSVAKISFEIRDKDGNKIDKGSLFLGKEDFEEFPILKKHFLGHKKVDQSEMKYDEKKLPPTLHLKKEKNPDAKPATVHFSIVDIKNVILPEMTDENIKKFFGSDATIKTNDDLIAKIRDVLEEQKYEHALTKVIDAYIDSVAAHITVSVPKTIIEEEFKSRMQSFQKRV
jgi:FKBP-type peptidyl-prolyl cis-trans isomerase (trigger factor)